MKVCSPKTKLPAPSPTTLAISSVAFTVTGSLPIADFEIFKVSSLSETADSVASFFKPFIVVSVSSVDFSE